jgi:hypothetical protein
VSDSEPRAYAEYVWNTSWSSRKKTLRPCCAWSFRKGFVKLGHITFAGESNRVAVVDFVLIDRYESIQG